MRTDPFTVNPSGTPVSSHYYHYNDANQRTRVNLADGSFWIYDYDALGQVKSGKRYWSDWTPVAGQQFEYGFDDIGNRNSTKSGGDSAGGNLRLASYTNNSLNQITSRDVPAYLNVIGAATATATNVNVNDSLAYRKGEYYRVELNPDNTNGAAWQSVTNRAVQSGTTNSVTGNAFLAKNPEVFGYDADGNLTNDGRWAYGWDGENRLVRQFAPTTAPSGSVKALTFGYDWQARRISKTVSNYSGGTWSRVLEEKYLYDGWNLLSSLNATNSAVVQAFLWGTDLSGSMQGAGGVGGLLAVNAKGVSVTFAAYDGNGNVTALANAAEGSTLATYEYGPFGEVIRVTGTLAKLNPFRFSTKFQDDETDYLYYGYRFYSQSTGRWLSRDPIEELDGPNLYAIVHNNPANRVDKDGTTGWQFTGPWDHDYFDPKCPGPDETDALILGMAATLLTPVPGDEAIVGALILKRLEKVLNSCKPCKNFRCSLKILHPPHHYWPAPGDPNGKSYRRHIHIICYDKTTGRKIIDKRFPFGPHYKQPGGHGGETW